MSRRALVVGVTGISGGNVAQRLLSDGWEVAGLCRTPGELDPRITPLAADLEDPVAVAAAVRGTAPTHVFFTTWSRRATEAENIDVNGRMLQNLLDAAAPEGSVQHVALITGLKHYLGPFEAYAKAQPDTPFSEEQPRLPYENFYYTQEDILFAAAERDGFTWSVHRPHTLIGWALGNAMNMGVTLAVYGAICRETGQPFRYPGSQTQWEAITDVTDATLLADHLVWASTTPGGGEPGAQHRQRRRVPLAPAVAPPGRRAGRRGRRRSTASPPRSRCRWPRPPTCGRASSRRHGLRDLDVGRLASWWHSDADLGRTVETFTDMGKSRRLGFQGVRDTESSFTDLFARLRAERVVP